jgi:hypothetical protein
MSRRFTLSLLSATALATAGCVLFEEDKAYNPVIDPAHFALSVDNRYFPLVPGTAHHFHTTSDEGEQDNVVTVTPQTRLILGVTCTVVHDVVTEDGTVTEDTWDWFAQDRDGNV